MLHVEEHAAVDDAQGEQVAGEDVEDNDQPI